MNHLLSFARALAVLSLPVFLSAILACGQAAAAPHKPINPQEVLERLPVRLSNQDETVISGLRNRLRLSPNDPSIAAELAERYYRIAMRQGDPRYIGYAQAVIAPWRAAPNPGTDIRLARALLAQFLHDFDLARRDLDAVLAAEPKNLAALSYRAIMSLVGARYAEARQDCAELERYGSGLIVEACRPTIDAVTGQAEKAYRSLQKSLRLHPDAPENERLWVLTRLAEVALRLGRNDQADAHFREALAIGIDDQYLLAAYAEFLLDLHRPQQVIGLLRGHLANDVLLLRLALAEQASNHPDASIHTRMLADRFEANRRRGDTTHLADEAVFELHFRKNYPRALALAANNWGLAQREPSDARIFLEAALAAGRPDEAIPVTTWLRETGIEDATLRRLGDRLASVRTEPIR